MIKSHLSGDLIGKRNKYNILIKENNKVKGGYIMMTNKLLGTIFYVISVISAILMLVSFGWFIVPDPLPIVVDDALALQASMGFFIVFISTFVAGSCLRKDGSAKDFVDNMAKAGNVVNIVGAARKCVE